MGSRVLKLSRATTLLYWEMMGQDYSLNNGSQPYPILSFLDQLEQQFPPGAQVVQSSDNRSAMQLLAARTDGWFVVLLTNQSVRDRVQISGLPDGTYYLIRSSAKETNQYIDAFTVAGAPLELDIPGFSINFLTTKRPESLR
jgi:hypothetical protein